MSTAGSTSNDGSTLATPWPLSYAVAGAGGRIWPGDTVWLRGGTYSLAASSATAVDVIVNGTVAAPIEFASYPGEMAVLDDPRATVGASTITVNLRGDYLVFRDIVVTNSNPFRETTAALANAVRPEGIAHQSLGGKLVNVISHDTGNGIFWASGAKNSEIIGAICFNYGFLHTDTPEPFCHSVYTQSLTGFTKHAVDVLWAGGYNYNFHAFVGGEGSQLDGYTIENSTSIDGFILTHGKDAAPNTVPGGGDQWGGSVSGKPMTNLTVDRYFHDDGFDISDQALYPDTIRVRNSFWLGAHTARGLCEFDGTSNIKEFKNNSVFRRNSVTDPPMVRYIPNSGRTTTFSPASPSDIDGNRYFGNDAAGRVIEDGTNTLRTLAQWRTATGYDLTSTFTNTATGPADFADVVANPAEIGRATVRIFKAPSTASFAVDLSGVLSAGDAYWLYDGRNPLAGAFASGTYDGTSVTVTFSDLPGRAIPVGWSSAPVGNQATHPVVIVRRVGPAWVAPPLALRAP